MKTRWLPGEALSHGDLDHPVSRRHAWFTGEPQPFKAGLYNLAQRFPNVVLVPA